MPSGRSSAGSPGCCRVLLLGLLNAPLHFAHRIQVIAHLAAVARAQVGARAATRRPARNPACCGSRGSASRALPYRWSRRRRTGARTPRADWSRTAAEWSASSRTACCCRRSYSPNRIRPPGGRLRGPVRAKAAASAVPISWARIWSTEMRVLDVGAFRLLGMHAGEPGGARARMVARAIAQRFAVVVLQPAQHQQSVAEGFDAASGSW